MQCHKTSMELIADDARSSARATAWSSATAATPATRSTGSRPSAARARRSRTCRPRSRPSSSGVLDRRPEGLPADDLDAADLPPGELRGRRDRGRLRVRNGPRAARSSGRSGTTRPRSPHGLHAGPRAEARSCRPSRSRATPTAARGHALVGCFACHNTRALGRRGAHGQRPDPGARGHQRARPEPARRGHQGHARVALRLAQGPAGATGPRRACPTCASPTRTRRTSWPT